MHADQLLRDLSEVAQGFTEAGNRGAEAAARFELGGLLLQLGRGSAAFEQLSRAAEILEQEGLASPAAQALLGCGHALTIGDRHEDSLWWFDRAIRRFSSCGDKFGALEASAAKLEVLADIGQWTGTELSDGLIAATEDTVSPQLLKLRLVALRYQTQERLAAGDPTGAVDPARRAAAVVGQLGDRDTEATFRLALAHNLRILREFGEAAHEYDIALTLARSLPASEDLARQALDGLRVTLGGCADRFLEIANEYADAGDTRMEAQCRYQRARSLGQNADESAVRSGGLTALLDLRIERAREYERAAGLFEAVGQVGEAGRSRYQAAYEYSLLGLARPEYRETCYSTCLKAVEDLEAAGDWWGAGMAEFVAGQVLRPQRPGGAPDPRRLPLLRRAAESFTHADRPVEAAAASFGLAVTLAQAGGDEWMYTAVEALKRYEQARPSLRAPSEREINDRTVVADGARILAGKAIRSAASVSDRRVWDELVWLLSEAPKARSFQDQHLQDETWTSVAADDVTLSELMTRRQNLTRERDDLELVIAGALIGGHFSSRLPAMEEELQLQQDGLNALDHQVADRFQRLYHDEPERVELLSSPPVGPDELQALLTPGEAYLSYRWHDGTPLRSTVTRTGVTVEVAAGITTAAVDAAVAAGREGDDLHGRGFPPTEQLIGPLTDRIDTLIISPDSLLIGLPWHLLPAPAPSAPDRTLGERYTVSVVPAAGVLRHLRTHAPYAMQVERKAAYLGVACNGGDYKPLGLVDREVEITRRDFFSDEPGSACFVTAHCEQFLTGGCDVGLLHLACHAEPHGLLLSLDGTWTRPTDLLSVPGRRFGADVVLLTGCSTGDFSQRENNEFLGVVRQLIVATGARAAVVSLAPVPDEAGLLFADLFVSALCGTGPNRPWPAPDRPLTVGPAVAWAQQTMRRRVRERDVEALIPGSDEAYPTDPAWWSPWFVVGDPKAKTTGRRSA
ncbi:CHAT domain-containing protein [Kitasatospora sp. NPDC048538]|uniref:CHAT domain-containing protein n=1 Tax=unclassified Kitasatospora TaxID=2633591 RepID=UPI0033DE2200